VRIRDEPKYQDATIGKGNDKKHCIAYIRRC
jgi:hypothetical protein